MTTRTQARTENGAPTLATSGTPLLDLFFGIGASRNQTAEQIVIAFESAYREDPEAATRIGLWARDARGGAGERRAFRVVFDHLIKIDLDRARRVLAPIPELGRWDDVLVALETPLEDDAVALIARALQEGDGLCAKWLPRKGPRAARLRRALDMTPKQYRKTLVGLTSVVETDMCDQRWDDINYGSVPSVAHSRYRRAFARHSPERYREYLDSVQRGDDKISAGAVMPYEVVRVLGNSAWVPDKATHDSVVAQWEALPDLGVEGSVLPVIDVSGSMGVPVSGSVTAMDVAVGLGIYLSERIQGQFQNQFITFSEKPQLQSLDGDVVNRIRRVRESDWGFNTNLEAVFQLILGAARRYNLSNDDIPNKIMIISDMEFDVATGAARLGSMEKTPTNFEAIDGMFEAYGYQRPDIVFWNVRASGGNVPVDRGQAGTALVSGFSPSIAQAVLAGDIDPVAVMHTAIDSERYDH